MAFSFPYSPYPDQLRLMQDIYACIVNQKIGVFESPTGTGKTLSVICSSFTWLENNLLEMQQNETKTSQADVNTCDWLERQLSKSHDQEKSQRTSRVRQVMNTIDENISKEPTNHLNRKRPLDLSLDDVGVEYQALDMPQIIYCSRTHSQISQFVREIRKTRFASTIRCTTLSSRRNSCINASVNCLSSDGEMNDKCLELIDLNHNDDTDQATSCGCPHLVNIDRLSYSSMSSLMDMEDVVKLGIRFNSCPYYASRKASIIAHVVALPYVSLLSPDTRESLNIKLKSSIIIIDEAHNLPDAIISTSRVLIPLQDLKSSLIEVETYLSSYSSRLSDANLLNVRQLILLLQTWVRYLSRLAASSCMTVSEFLQSSRVYQVNIPQLISFISKFKLCQKLVSISNTIDKDRLVPRRISYLSSVFKFLSMIVLSDRDGRVLLNLSESDGVSMKYVLMSLSNIFEPILSQARSIILVGGTLQPFNDLVHQLFPSTSCADRLDCVAYNHVVPRDNVVSYQISRGPNSIPFNFSFNSRNNPNMIHELGCLIIEVSENMMQSGGIVLFFTSYGYLSTVVDQWNSSFHSLLSKSELYIELEDGRDTDRIITSYSSACSTIIHSTGLTPILCCVLGGKLSEGINLSDEKSRVGIIIGLPYANKNDEELKIRMNHMDQLHLNGGRDLYQSSCFRLINQAVGRCIRHSNDYTCLLFVDSRFEAEEVFSKIANWAKFVKKDNYDEMKTEIRNFFTIKYNQSST